MIKEISINDDELIEIRKTMDKQFYLSDYSFLNAHKGMSPNKFYVFLSTAGGGKSTLRNSLIYDFKKNNPGKSVFLWLSEEKISDFKMDIARDREMAIAFKGVTVFSEQDNYKMFEREDAFDKFIMSTIESSCDLFIFDNITTSKLYRGNPTAQEKFTDSMKAELQDLDIPTIIFAHTASDVKVSSGRLIEESDIRGSRNLPNIAEYFYTLQTFNVKENRYSFIRTIKHRGRNTTGNFFHLVYDPNSRIYSKDRNVPFEEFNEYYKLQNRLGK